MKHMITPEIRVVALKVITDPELLDLTRKLAADERRIGVEILHHLREVRSRGLHLELGHSSLFSFCVAELKYSEAAAYQKIQALKLMDEVPEVEGKLEAGSLTVSNAAQIQSFSQAARKRGLEIPARAELVLKIENQSKREAARILADLSPAPLVEDRCRPVTSEHTEIRFVAGAELMQKLERLKALRSHVNVSPSFAELFEDLADLALRKLDPELQCRKGVRRNELRPGKVPAAELRPGKVTSAPNESRLGLTEAAQGASSTSFTSHRRRAIPTSVRRQVWSRDRGRCTYVDAKSGHSCGSSHLLQFDHRNPKALGGADSIENLRLLCSAHNLHAAIRVFGQRRP